MVLFITVTRDNTTVIGTLQFSAREVLRTNPDCHRNACSCQQAVLATRCHVSAISSLQAVVKNCVTKVKVQVTL
jgi:hypothetical protein